MQERTILRVLALGCVAALSAGCNTSLREKTPAAVGADAPPKPRVIRKAKAEAPGAEPATPKKPMSAPRPQPAAEDVPTQEPTQEPNDTTGPRAAQRPPRAEASSDNPNAETQSAAAERPSSALAGDPRRACRKDADCTLLPIRPCSCPPCGDVSREAVNKAAAERFRAKWARRRCRMPQCRPCQGRYVGTEAACTQGQCSVR